MKTETNEGRKMKESYKQSAHSLILLRPESHQKQIQRRLNEQSHGRKYTTNLHLMSWLRMSTA